MDINIWFSSNLLKPSVFQKGNCGESNLFLRNNQP